MSAQLAERTPFERWCSMVSSLIAYRDGSPSHALYERLKREFNQAVPDHTPEQYQRAMALAAKAAGV